MQGISDEFIPPICRLPDLDRAVAVDDGDAILMARKLAGQLGLGVGISSGANLPGALRVPNELGEGAVVVTVFPDDDRKYLSTELLKDEPARDDHLSRSREIRGERVDIARRLGLLVLALDDAQQRQRRPGGLHDAQRVRQHFFGKSRPVDGDQDSIVHVAHLLVRLMLQRKHKASSRGAALRKARNRRGAVVAACVAPPHTLATPRGDGLP